MRSSHWEPILFVGRFYLSRSLCVSNRGSVCGIVCASLCQFVLVCASICQCLPPPSTAYQCLAAHTRLVIGYMRPKLLGGLDGPFRAPRGRPQCQFVQPFEAPTKTSSFPGKSGTAAQSWPTKTCPFSCTCRPLASFSLPQSPLRAPISARSVRSLSLFCQLGGCSVEAPQTQLWALLKQRQKLAGSWASLLF